MLSFLSFAASSSYGVGAVALLLCKLQLTQVNLKQGFVIPISAGCDSCSWVDCAASTASLVVDTMGLCCSGVLALAAEFVLSYCRIQSTM